MEQIDSRDRPVNEAMVSAGVEVLRRYDFDWDSEAEAVAEIFAAMCRKA